MNRSRKRERVLTWWQLCLVALILTACGGGGSGDEAPNLGPPVRLEVDPGALLMTQPGERRTLSAKAFDARGNEVPASVIWSSSSPGVLTVSATGEVSAQGAVGSAQVVAQAGDLRAMVPVVVARPVQSAVMVADSDVLRIEAVDPAATFGAGYRYVITLQGVAPPALGAVVLGRETLPVGGRVVAVNAGTLQTEVTLEVLPLGQLFDDLQIRETFQLADLPAEISTAVTDYYSVTKLGNGRYAFRQKADRPIRMAAPKRDVRASRVGRAAETEFDIGPLHCTAEGGLADVELQSSAVEVDFSALRIEFEWMGRGRRLLLVGEPKFKFEFKPVYAAGLTGEVECKLTFFTIPVPAPAIVAALAGASVPIGAGFGVEGAVPVGGLGFESSAEYAYSVRAGVACSPDCSLQNEFLRTATQAEFKWIEPSMPVGVTLEAEASAFAFADIHVGARAFGALVGRVIGVRVADLEFLTSKAAFVLEGKLASEGTQSADPSFSAEYELGFKFAFGTGEDLQEALDALEILVNEAELSFPIQLGTSPKATSLTADRNSFRVGDVVNFAVDLSSVDFPLAGYNVESVRIYRKQVVGSETSLILAGEATAVPGQTEFEIPWVATVDGQVVEGSGATAVSNFVAFVKTRLLDTPLELGQPTVEDSGVRWLAGTITEELRDLRPERTDLERWIWNVRVSTSAPEDLRGEEVSGSVDYFHRYEFWGESDIDGSTLCKHATVTLTGRLTVVAYYSYEDSDPSSGYFSAAGSIGGTRVNHEGCDRHPGTEVVTPFTIDTDSFAGYSSPYWASVERNGAGRLEALSWGVNEMIGTEERLTISGRLALEP